MRNRKSTECENKRALAPLWKLYFFIFRLSGRGIKNYVVVFK